MARLWRPQRRIWGAAGRADGARTVTEREDVGCMVSSLLSDDNRWINAQNAELAGGHIIW